MATETNVELSPPTDAAPTAHDGRLLDLAWIAMGWAATALLLRPFQNTPFIDDWVYAWSVERLLEGGGLRVLDYSVSINVIQILWGTLFCLPFGFSFTALRLSTWIAALIGLWGLYVLLRDLGVSRRDALLGTSCLGAYPIFFILSLSFMTDVPLLVCTMWATLAFLRAMTRRSDGWLCVAVALSCAAVGIRITGIVAPIAMILTLMTGREGWGRQKVRFMWPATALLFFALIVWWSRGHIEAVADLTDVFNAPSNRLRLLKEQAFRLLPGMSLWAITFAAGALGLALLPMSVARVKRSRLRLAAVVMVFLAVATAIVPAGRSHWLPLTEGQTWSLGELGMTEPLVPDYDAGAGTPWWILIVTAVTLASTSLLIAGSARRLDPPGVCLLLQLLGQIALIALLWLFYDRYALVLVPLALALSLRGVSLDRPRVAGALIVAMGLVSLVGVRDHLDYNRALWSAVSYLERIGVEPAAFDGGYVVNGWLQYAHPALARRDASGGVAVPNMNVKATTAYRISNQARPQWSVITSIPYTRWAGRSGRLYVLRRDGEPDRSVGPP